MAGQNDMLSLPMNSKSLAPEAASSLGLCSRWDLWFCPAMIYVIYYSFWRPNKLPYAD